jgi:RNA polymerase sigma factor (sigma-70 family)
MNMTASDQDLLRQFTRDQSQDAFTALVQRHLNLVYSAAVRQVRSPQLAEEVAQSVFSDLARQAARLRPDTILTAWLYQVTRRTAIDAVRRESRRQAREHIATEMNTANTANLSRPDPLEADWTRVECLLDEAMHALADTDRAAVLLRYFENKPLREVGAALGTSDDAAQKRVNRAVERLRKFFAKRGVSVGASGLTLLISVNAVQASPAGLALTISGAAAVVGTTTAATTATAATAKIVAMTTLQKALVAAAVTVLAGAGVYEGRQASRLRDQIETLQQQQAPLVEQAAALKTENQRLSNQVAMIQEANALSQAQLSELLKLRGRTTPAQIDPSEIARLKATLAEQSGKMPDYMTNAIAAVFPTWQKMERKNALAQLARMKEKFNFMPDQELAVSNILMMYVERRCQIRLDEIMDRGTPEQREQQAQAYNDKPDTEIKALLTPEQLAAYPEYLQQEKKLEADSSAGLEVDRITVDLRLSNEQQEKVRQKLCELNLKDTTYALVRQAMNEARRNGRLAEGIQTAIELQKSQLEEKLKALGEILTPEQVNAYREEELKLIDMNAATMKLEPPPAAGTAR